jgi:MFS family permease
MGNSAGFEPRDNDKQINLSGHKLLWVSIFVMLLSFCVYALTAFRTITWWDNAEYSLAAITFGVTHPPGSLLTVLLGWLVTKIPLGLTAIFKLNLLAGLAASLTTAILVQTAVRYRRNLTFEKSGVQPRYNSWSFIIGSILGGLAYAFSETTWTYSTKLSPYIFTALFSSTIVWVLLRWWEDSGSEKSMQWLFVIGLLFGLDFSVHRTNMLLVPAAFLWIVVGNWRVLKSVWSWLSGILGYVIGLSVQLLLIPMAATNPYLNGGDPSTIGRFWDYVSLKQFGGNWLLNIFPRKAPFWSYQLHDYFNTFSANFFSTGFNLGIWGIFPVIFGVFGFILLWKSNRRLAIATIILFVIASLGAILYFNLPENYFRSNDRHYMPSFVIFACLIILGCGYFVGAISSLLQKARWAIVIPALFLIWVLPSYQLARNYHSQDCSRNYFTYDFAHNLMATLPERAILFTNGDADTFNPWYLQGGEKERPDVSIINLPLLNMPSYVSQVLANNPDLVISLTSAEIENLNVRPWTDTIVSISARCNQQTMNIPDNISIPDSVAFHITPNIVDKYLLAQDWMLLQIITANAWQRPIYFAMTVSEDNLCWVAPYLRSEGAAQRLIPMQSPAIDRQIMSDNLMGKYLYRGLADSSMPLDKFTKDITTSYYPLFINLATADAQAGDIKACQNTIKFMKETLPINRLGPLPESFTEAINSACDK